MPVKKTKGALHIIGLGTKYISQVTLESNSCALHADVLAHCEPDPRITDYAASIGKREVNLSHFIKDGARRPSAYQSVADAVIQIVQSGQNCAFLAPGNPVFLNSVVHRLRIAARNQGIHMTCSPGVSSIDCMINDLFPWSELSGFHCFESTTFVAMRPRVDTRFPLLLFQPGVVGVDDVRLDSGPSVPGVRLLQNALVEVYERGERWIAIRTSMANDDGPIAVIGILDELEKNAAAMALGSLVIPGPTHQGVFSSLQTQPSTNPTTRIY